MIDNSEKLKWILERQLGWIASADAKLTVIGPLPVALLAISLAGAKDRLTVLNGQDFPFIAATFFLLISLYFVGVALSSRLKGPESSNVFFGKIIGQSESDYKKSVLQEEVTEHCNDLAAQIYVNARIANFKHKHVSRAITFMIVAIPFWLTSIAIG